MLICISIISFVTVLSYSLLLYLFFKGISFSEQNTQAILKASIKSSLIIAFRNEEQNLTSLIEDIGKQSYKISEVIFVNDHSNDKGSDIVLNAINKYPNLKLLNLPDCESGKKAALYYGVKQAVGDVLLFTDADCSLKPFWAESMLNTLKLTKSKLTAGPVDMINKKGFFNALQNLEFLSLTGSTAGGFGAGIPFICNGANLAVDRDVFLNYFKTLGNNYASGDDVFLLHTVKKNHKVSFCYNPNAIVETLPQKSFKDFLLQRVRWAGKARGYHDRVSVLISALLLIVNLILILLLIFAAFEYRLLLIFGTAILIKTIFDILFMNKVLKFYKKQNLLKYIFLLQILYPFYVVVVGVMGIFYKPQWKGRKIS